MDDKMAGGMENWRSLSASLWPEECKGALHASSPRLRRAAMTALDRLAASLPHGLAVLDQSAHIVHVNEHLCRLIGVPPSDLIAHPLAHFIAPESRHLLSSFWAAPNDAAKKDDVFMGGIEWLRPNAKPLSFQMRCCWICDPHLSLRGCFMHLIADAERRRESERIKEQKNMLASMQEEVRRVNIAMEVMLQQHKKLQAEIEMQVMVNIKEMVQPYVERLKKICSTDQQKGYLQIIDNNLDDITSPLIYRLSWPQYRMTPQELKVAKLISQGKATKEIAERFNLSMRTIESCRINIRKKLGIHKKKINLVTFLQSLSQGSALR